MLVRVKPGKRGGDRHHVTFFHIFSWHPYFFNGLFRGKTGKTAFCTPPP